MVTAVRRPSQHGFTLVELMIVMAILTILMTMAALPFQQFIANARLRTVSSDLAGDLALARAEAIGRSARVGLARTTSDWGGGWSVFHDANLDGVFDAETDHNGRCDAGEECVLLARPAVNEKIRICSADAEFDVLTFGGDGAVRAFSEGVAIAIPRVTISSAIDLPGVPARRLDFSPGGRVSVVANGVSPCP
jgi:prepilin-type N-terminal cleavage/methylation domain-containing protein